MLEQIASFATPVVTAQQILDCLFAEYDYWLKADCEASIGATAAISNVIAFATIEKHRAEWHPAKTLAEMNEETRSRWAAILDAPVVVWHCPKLCNGAVTWNTECTIATCGVCGLTSAESAIPP